MEFLITAIKTVFNILSSLCFCRFHFGLLQARKVSLVVLLKWQHSPVQWPWPAVCLCCTVSIRLTENFFVSFRLYSMGRWSCSGVWHCHGRRGHNPLKFCHLYSELRPQGHCSLIVFTATRQRNYCGAGPCSQSCAHSLVWQVVWLRSSICLKLRILQQIHSL
jgi:hypothetical protein